MTQRSRQFAMPIQGMYSLLRDLAKQQGHPLVLNQEWKNDSLKQFFQTLVEDGLATWNKKITFMKRMKIAFTWRAP